MIQATSRAAYHSLTKKESQEERVARMLLYYTSRGLDATIGELAHALKMEKATVSARLNGLRYLNAKDPDNPANRRWFLIDGAEMVVECSQVRKCTRSNVRCMAWKVVPASTVLQQRLF